MLRQLRQLLGARPISGVSDDYLLRQFRTRREEDAFAAMVQRHGPSKHGAAIYPSRGIDAFSGKSCRPCRKPLK
jgi:hypothetical protein